MYISKTKKINMILLKDNVSAFVEKKTCFAL